MPLHRHSSLLAKKREIISAAIHIAQLSYTLLIHVVMHKTKQHQKETSKT